ncbi:MAG TPA: ATP-binding protein [Thermoanaerobaculia bacterium]|nr:ATP-binding protein [Thermoanaerobaculia bacterium]
METLTRVCLIGPECTGKSDLAAALATHYGTVASKEFARQYAEGRSSLFYEDVEAIARGQMAEETAAEPAALRLIILDTDLISTVVYSRHYYGRCPDWVVAAARERRADLYLLMDTDVPWQPDAARDAGGDEREDLFDEFRAALDEFEARWEIVSGSREERLAKAVENIDRRS